MCSDGLGSQPKATNQLLFFLCVLKIYPYSFDHVQPEIITNPIQGIKVMVFEWCCKVDLKTRYMSGLESFLILCHSLKVCVTTNL